jgi:hypothetical protein
VTVEEFYDLPDAEDRIAVYEIEKDRCQFHGGPYSECGDDERDWFPQLSVCHPTMQLKFAQRRFEKLHEDEPYHDGYFRFWSKEPTKRCPFHYTDGATIFLSPEDLNLGGDFLKQQEPPDPIGLASPQGD